MHYVMSDIHGEYEKYKAMLKKIRFSQDDDLYVLGDVVDRGPKPVEVLRDMSTRWNVFPIMGNHDAVAIHVLGRVLVEDTEETCETHLTPEDMAAINDWKIDGGTSTWDGFYAVKDNEMRFALLDYLREFSLYEIVKVGGRKFVLVHAGLQNFDENRPLDSYTADELLFDRQDLSRQYYSDPNTFVVVGHIPTPFITGKPEIHQANNNICIDCGAAMPEGRLACLCLDTMEEFYV